MLTPKWETSSPVYDSDQLSPMLAVSPWAGHRNFAYDLICFVKPRIVVELGTYSGCPRERVDFVGASQ